jgi:dUTP pyrophosphatase
LSTGLAFGIPEGYEGQIRPRSGLSFNKDCDAVLGTADQDYLGEIKVRLRNHSFQTMRFTTGDRVAQLVIVPVARVQLEVVGDLGTTDRGDKGFGSSGMK